MNLGLLALSLALTPANPPMPAPFLFVRVMGPGGSVTTWYPATDQATSVADGTVVGLRPGYCYRLEMANVGENKSTRLYPSIEVRGVLRTNGQLNIARHPVPIVLSEEDIERILEGRFLTKVYYLEDPNQALVTPNKMGIPFELRVPNEEEAIKEARERGRLVLILRVGERGFTAGELQRGNVPGTVLFPGAKSIPMPAAPPYVAYGGIPLFDPLLGPKITTEECFHDGGDHKIPIGIGENQKVFGLDPSDTAMEFTTPRGRQVTTSNRVCICIPKFGALKTETAVSGYQGMQWPQIHQQKDRVNLTGTKIGNGNVKQLEQLVSDTGSMRPSGLQTETGLSVKTTMIGKPQAVARVNGTQVSSEVREVDDITTYPGCNVLLMKRMVPPNPQDIGEEVTFYLRYTNPTRHEMTNVVISDSLSGRLEYLQGTARSSRPATFTAVPNEASSVIVRWVIDGKLLPGEHGVVSFKARIR